MSIADTDHCSSSPRCATALGRVAHCLTLCLIVLVSLVNNLEAQLSNELINEQFERVYIPEKDLAEYWNHAEPGVLLGRAEFEAMLDQSQQNQAASQNQPAGIVLERIEYRVSLEGDLLHIEADCTLRKYTAGWATLQLPLRGISLISATLNDKPAPLGRDNDTGVIRLVDNFTGQQKLTLVATTPIERAGTDELATFSISPNAAAQLKISVPAGRILQLNGSTVTSAGAGEATRDVSVSVGGLKTIQLRLTDSLGESLEESLVFAQTHYSILVAQEAANWQAVTQLTLYGKSFDRIEFTVPNSLEITDVEAVGLQAWELQDDPTDDSSTNIVLTFRESIPLRLSVAIRGVQLLSDTESWSVAPLELAGVTAHSGRLLISTPPEMRIKTLALEGIRPTTNSWNPPGDFPAGIRHYYDVWQADFTFRLSTLPTEREIQAAVSHLLDVGEFETTLSTTITLQTLFAPLYELSVNLPPDWTPSRVYGKSKEIDWQYISRDVSSPRIRILVEPPLKPGEKRNLWVVITRNQEQSFEKDQKLSLELPEVQLDNVQILEGSYGVTAQDRLEVVPVDITGMDPILLGLPNERFGYRYQNAHIGGKFEVQRKPARFNASSRQVVSVDEESVTIQLLSNLDISGGGVREVDITLTPLPEIEAEFQSLSGIQIARQERTATEAGMKWHLTMDRFVTGNLPLALKAIIPVEGADQISIPEPVVADAELQDLYLGFAAEQDQRFAVTVAKNQGADLFPSDPADLPLSTAVGSQRIVTGYHITKPGISATLSVTEFEPWSIPTAVGHRVTLETVLQESGQIQQQASLNFSAVGIQSLLIKLPDNSELWSTTVDGQPVTARQTKEGFSIPALQSASGTGKHILKVIYGLDAENADFFNLTSLRLPAPQFAVLDGDGTTQPLPILETVWKLHHAGDAHIVPLDQGLSIAERTADETWLDRVVRQVNHQSWSEILQNAGLGLLVILISYGLAKFVLVITAAIRNSTHSIPGRWVIWSVLGICSLGIVAACLLPGIQTTRYAARVGQLEDADVDISGRITIDMPAEEADKSRIILSDDIASTDFESGNLPNTVPAETPPPLSEPEGEAQTRKLSISGEGLTKSAPEPAARPGSNTKQDLQNNQMNEQFLGMEEAEQIIQQRDERAAGLSAESKAGMDGLLSLSMSLNVPPQMQTTILQSYSEASLDDGLNIRYLSETSLQRTRWLIMAGVVLVFMLMRFSRPATKLILAILTLSIPVLLIGVLPSIFLPVIEGLFWGGLLGLLLWLSLALIHLLMLVGQKFCLNFCQPKKVTTILLIGFGLSISANAEADEQTAVPQAQSPAEVGQSNSSTQEILPLVAAPAKTTLVFPYTEGQSPLAADRVFVPRKKYLEIWRQDNPTENLEPAPQAWQLNEASYVAQLVSTDNKSTETSVSLQARFVIRSYRDREQMIPLPVGEVIIDSAVAEGKPVPTALTAENHPAVLIATSGLHVVDVQFRLKAESVGTAGQFRIPLQSTVAGSLSFELPQEDLQLRVNDGSIPYQLVTRAGKSYAEIPITSGGERVIAWQPKVTGTNLQFLSSESSREVLIGDTGANLRYAFTFQIAQGSFTEVEFQLPANVRLKSIACPQLAGWQKLENGRLRILFKQAIEESVNLTIELFAPLEIDTDAAEFVCPDLVPQGVTREIGTWAISWNSSLSVKVASTEGVRQLKADQFQPINKAQPAAQPDRVYRFSGRPQLIRLTVQRQVAEAMAQLYTVMDIQQHKTHLATLTEVTLEGEPRLSLEYILPQGLQIIDVTADNLQDWFISTEIADTPGSLTVVFQEPQQGQVKVLINSFIQKEAKRAATLPVSGIELLDAGQVTHWMGIGAAEILGLKLEQTAGWQSVAPQQLPQTIQSMARFPLRFGFTSSNAKTEPILMSVDREDAQIKAQSMTLIAVSDVSLDYGLSLQWIVSKAATDRFQLLTPTWFKDRIKFQSAEIRQVRSAVEGDQLLWTIESKTPQSEKLFVTAVISLPLPEDRTVTTPAIRFVRSSQDGPESLENQSHYGMLVNLGQEPLEPISEHERLLVNESELPIKVPEELARQAMEIVQVTGQIVPSWELKQIEEQESFPATIGLAELTTVIDATGTWRTLANYTVKNRRRQFLTLRLPDESKLLSVLVADNPSRSVKSRIGELNVHMIALPPRGAADLSFQVQIVLQGRFENSARWNNRDITLPAPAVLSQKESADYGIPTMHTVWNVSTSNQLVISYTGSEKSNMTPANRESIERLQVTNRLQEMAELAQIVSVRSNSYSKRTKAANNLKQLNLAIQNSSDHYGEEIQQQQSQVLGEVNRNLVQLESEQVQFSDNNQANGRLFIFGCNDAIMTSNGAQGLEITPSANPAVLQSQTRIQTDQFQFGEQQQKAEAGKKSKMMRQQSLDRKSLIQENFDNSIRGGYKSDFDNALQQQPFDINGDSSLDGIQRKDSGRGAVTRFTTPNEFMVDESKNGNGIEIVPQADKSAFGFSMYDDDPFGTSGPHQVREGINGTPTPNNNRAGVSSSFQNLELGQTPQSLVPNSSSTASGFETVLASGQPAVPEEWTSTGGLSIPLKMPVYEDAVVFTKVGGDPELTIRISEQQQSDRLYGWLWTLGAAILVIWLLISSTYFLQGKRIGLLLSIGIVLGIAAFALLPEEFALTGLIIAIACGMLLAIEVGRQRRQAVA